MPAPRLSAPWLMVLASLLFSTMGVCIKLASSQYVTGEIVFYRGLVGALVMLLVTRAQGGRLSTAHPWPHLWRSLSGVCALALWFYAIGQLPLATAVTLNYTSSVWMALFLIGSAVMLGSTPVDRRLLLTIAIGFVGVAMVLRPTLNQNQLWAGLIGLLSGMLSATAYLQVAALGRLGEPEYRVVFYFSLGSVAVGAISMGFTGASSHTLQGACLLIGVGVCATAAQWAMTRAYAVGSRLVNASLQYLAIAFSFVFGVVIFHDPITAWALMGMLLIIGAGLVASRLRPPLPSHQHIPQPLANLEN